MTPRWQADSASRRSHAQAVSTAEPPCTVHRQPPAAAAVSSTPPRTAAMTARTEGHAMHAAAPATGSSSTLQSNMGTTVTVQPFSMSSWSTSTWSNSLLMW